MSRAGFQKSVRMFHKFSEETLRRRGGEEGGRESVDALAAIDSVLKAERLFDGTLLDQLSAFTNLLQSSQLPPDFGSYSFGDALLAVEEAHAELRQNADQRWEFEPAPSAEDIAQLRAFLPKSPAPAASTAHAVELRRFVLDAAASSAAGKALIIGALSAPELPLAELAERFDQLTLSDLDLPGLEQLVQSRVDEKHRAKIKLERYDATGSYVALAKAVTEIVAVATSEQAAEAALADLLQSYDVGSGSAGLSLAEEKPELAISAMLLSELGSGYESGIAAALTARGWDGAAAIERAPLQPALTLLRCLFMQHHVQALLRRAGSAVLISAVSQVELRQLPNGQKEAEDEPLDLLWVEQLSERLPQIVEVKAEQSWEWAEIDRMGTRSAAC